MKKKIFSISLLLLLSDMMPAQNRIGYSYDSAGNRVQRAIILQAPKAPPVSKIRESFTDNFGKRSIKIYPNPTLGRIRVSIAGFGGEDNCELTVYSASGQQIFKETNARALTYIDFSKQLSGIYLLKIVLNGELTTWKIIKR